jgi:hypothetical protein
MRYINKEATRGKLKSRGLAVATLLISALSLSAVKAQTLYVNQTNGMQATYALHNVRKLTFSQGNLNVIRNDNSSSVYTLHGLRYLSFKDFVSNISEQSTTTVKPLKTYPNPVQNVLYVDLTGTIAPHGIISILSLEGRLLQMQQIRGTGIVNVDVSPLKPGVYICHYFNETEIKTVKIIKQ